MSINRCLNVLGMTLFFIGLTIGCANSQNRVKCPEENSSPQQTAAVGGESLEYTKTLPNARTIDEAVEKVTQALSAEGFGVVTDMDVQAIMKKKLDKDMRPYRILGACNPKLAFQAIEQETTMGLLLPCKIIVYQNDQNEFMVSFARPKAVFQLIRNSTLTPLAEQVDDLLRNVFESL